MNLINQARALLDTGQQFPDLVLPLSNIIIPKMMHIPLVHLSELQDRISHLSQEESHSIDEQFLTQLIQGFILYRQTHYHASIHLLKKAVILPVLSSSQACAFVLLGANYRSLGNSEMALQQLQSGHERFTGLSEQPYQQYFHGLSIYHIAELFGELGDYDAMLQKNILFKEHGEKWNNPDMIGRALNGIGRAYTHMSQYEKAIEFMMEAELKSTAGNIPFRARNLHDIGLTHFHFKHYDEALIYFGKALELREQHQLTNARITSLVAIADVYLYKSAPEMAIPLLNEAKEAAEGLKVNKKMLRIYKCLSYAYEISGDLRKALDYYKQYESSKEEHFAIQNTQVENQKIREINSQLKEQKETIEQQKKKIEINLRKIQHTNKYLQNFASMAAHDLKAPIRIASNFAQILEKKYKDNLEVEDLEFLQYISVNIRNLGRMIDDLLSLTKLDQNLPTPSLVNVFQVILEAQSRLREKIQASRTEISILGDLPDVMAHDSLLVNLFQNILDNAIKHQHPDNHPVIEISSSFPNGKGHYCQIRIKDNGLGIPSGMEERIFELFNKSSMKDSSGIGLATCKKIVNHYGGKIWVESEIGEGTSFLFTLPLIGNEIIPDIPSSR